MVFFNSREYTESIKFTHEEEESESIAFLDMLIVREEDTRVMKRSSERRPIQHQYLSFSSHQKMGVIRTLLDRCDGILTEEEDRRKEKETLKDPLTLCGYLDWAMRSVREKFENKSKN